MVVAISVLAIIGTALMTVIVLVLRGNSGLASMATDARDEQLVGTYFVRDVESATSVDHSAPTCVDLALKVL